MKQTFEKFKDRKRTIACNFYIFREFFKNADSKNRIMDLYKNREKLLDNEKVLDGEKLLARQHMSDIIHYEKKENEGKTSGIDYLLNWECVDKDNIVWKTKKIITQLSMTTGIKSEIFRGDISFALDFEAYLKNKKNEDIIISYGDFLTMCTNHTKECDFSLLKKVVIAIIKDYYLPNYKNHLLTLDKEKPLDCLYYFSVSKGHKSIQADDIELWVLKDNLNLITKKKCLVCEENELLEDVKKELERVWSDINTILKYRNLKSLADMSTEDD